MGNQFNGGIVGNQSLRRQSTAGGCAEAGPVAENVTNKIAPNNETHRVQLCEIVKSSFLPMLKSDSRFKYVSFFPTALLIFSLIGHMMHKLHRLAAEHYE